MEGYMRCPIDGETLVMADRGGVEIDYCPKCRGVWLDRGELDKIIERSVGLPAPAPAPAARPAAPLYQPEPGYAASRHEQPRRHDDDDDDDDDHRRKKHKKRDSFLSELFDF
jgi:Zn-finger nucleic acid-binding protein